MNKKPIPPSTMLEKYSTPEGYADCYTTAIAGNIDFNEYIFAFYTSPLFKLERMILKLVVGRPSTDLQARELADGSTTTFAAWHIEERSKNEILLCDFMGRTRSWLMTASNDTGRGPGTHLYFGSAIVPTRKSKTGELSLGFVYRALLGFHRVYSVLLLYAAKSRLRAGTKKGIFR